MRAGKIIPRGKINRTNLFTILKFLARLLQDFAFAASQARFPLAVDLRQNPVDLLGHFVSPVLSGSWILSFGFSVFKTGDTVDHIAKIPLQLEINKRERGPGQVDAVSHIVLHTPGGTEQVQDDQQDADNPGRNWYNKE